MTIRVWVPVEGFLGAANGERPIDYEKGVFWDSLNPSGNLLVSGRTEEAVIAEFPAGQWRRVEQFEGDAPPVDLPEPSEGQAPYDAGSSAGVATLPAGWPAGDPTNPDGLEPCDKRLTKPA